MISLPFSSANLVFKITLDQPDAEILLISRGGGKSGESSTLQMQNTHSYTGSGGVGDSRKDDK